MIAHRLCTVKCCDRIIQLANGIVQREGLPRDILAS